MDMAQVGFSTDTWGSYPPSALVARRGTMEFVSKENTKLNFFKIKDFFFAWLDLESNHLKILEVQLLCTYD